MLFQGGGDKALVAVGTVVGHDNEIGAGILQFVHQNGQIHAAEAHNHVHLRAQGMQRRRLGIGDGNAQSAADNGHPFSGHVAEFTFPAQGAHEIQNTLALFQQPQPPGGGAHLLENNLHRAFVLIAAGDGQGNPLSVFIYAQYDKLPGLCPSGHCGGLHVQHGGLGVEFPFMNNLKHNSLRFPLFVHFYAHLVSFLL